MLFPRPLVLFALGALLADAQKPLSDAFKVDVKLVNMAFTVRDAKGSMVTDLAKDEVEVFEDGVQQKVAFFARSSDLPLSLGLVQDASGSQSAFLKSHHRDLQAFLDRVLRKTDQAFLVCFGNRIRLVSNFTGSSREILDGLQQFEKGERGFPELGPAERRILGTGFYDAVYYAVSEKLAAVNSARRAIIIFSDGEDNSSAHHMLDAIEEAQISDVPLFAVRYTETIKGRPLNARNKYGIRVMDRIAKETGGLHFDARERDLKVHFDEIGDELRSSYSLGYYPAGAAHDGTFRKVVIRVKREGVKVRAKTGYFGRQND